MPDFTSVFTQERDHWRDRAEAAEAELERERARAREHLDARCRAEGRSEAWQMNADGWRQRATRAEAEVERLRGALDELRAECMLNATDNLLPKDVRDVYEQCAKSLRLLRGDQ
ncbi:hypothetical protein [Mycolicibacter minnesotensis]